MKKIKKNIALFLLSFMFLNVFYCKVSALEKLPQITSAVMEKPELEKGEEQAVKVKTDYAGNVQYLVYQYDYNTKKWTDLTGGYLPAVKGTNEHRISLGKNFSVGNGRITVRVKRAGQVGKYNNVSFFQDYDSYDYVDFTVKQGEILPNITSAVMERPELEKGEEQAVKVKTDYAGNVQYLVYQYDYNTKKWTDLTGGYLPAVKGTNEHRISLGKNFSVGNGRITVRVKRAGQVGKYNNVSFFQDYDSYAYVDFTVKQGEILPNITSAVMEKPELGEGEEQAVKVKTDYAGNVQYLVYQYDYNTKKWTDLTGGYLPAVKGTNEHRISLGKNFSVGNGRITVRVKRAGQVGKYNNVSFFQDYDSYDYVDFKVIKTSKCNVSIGLTQLGNINSLDFSLTGNYNVKGDNLSISLAAGKYTAKLNEEGFNIYQDGILIKNLSTNEIVIKPVSDNTYIKFVKESYTRNFPGEIILRKKSDNNMLVVNKLDIEDYTKGVLPFEMGESFSIEALKAQAVVARTYAIANEGRYSSYGYDLTDDTRCQVYRGCNPNLIKCNRAVDETKGKVLKYLGQAISAVYCSSNGGYTEGSENVWWGSLGYLTDQRDPFDSIRPSHLTNWKEEKSNEDIFELLKKSGCNIKEFVKIDISNIEKYPSGRIKKLNLIYKDLNNVQQKLELTKERARTFFGLKSAMYDVKYENSKYVFIGNGWGHGVGMSQWGAEGMARQNSNYSEILKFYYKNISIDTMDVIY